MSLMNDDKSGNNGGLPDLQTGSDPNGLVANLMGLQQQQNNTNGLQAPDGTDANANSALMGGMSGGMMGVDGQADVNSFLAQQQALMAMAAGAGTGAGGGAGTGNSMDNGSNKDALMSFLSRQGLGAPMGGMNFGPAPIGMGNAMGLGAVGGIGGIQNNPLGGIGAIGGLGRSNGNGTDNIIGGPMDNAGGLLANPVLSGLSPGLQGGLQGGPYMGMGGKQFKK